MKSRKKREGVELEMWVNSQCAELLMLLPSDGREAAVEWLRKRVVYRPDGAQAPLPPDRRQLELPATEDPRPATEDLFGAPA